MFGFLEVTEKVVVPQGVGWRCRCVCGNTIRLSSSVLVTRKSCGCSPEHHGESQPTKEYRAWSAMKTRCYIAGSTDYANYGGRGIRVCDRWLKDFKNFLHDVGRAPTSDHTIDRFPNREGNYEPGNVRWATPYEQANNTRRNRFLDFQGERLTVSQWAVRLGVNRGLIKDRIGRLKWSVEKALSTPAHSKFTPCKRS